MFPGVILIKVVKEPNVEYKTVLTKAISKSYIKKTKYSIEIFNVVKINESRINLKKRFILIKRLIKPDVKFFKKLIRILSIFFVKKLIFRTMIENIEMSIRKI